MPLVDVPDIGQVSFPDQMSEDDISAAINDHFKQVGVEQSIRATQLPIGIMTNPGVGAAAVGARDYADQERLINRATNIPTNELDRAAADYLRTPEDFSMVRRDAQGVLRPMTLGERLSSIEPGGPLGGMPRRLVNLASSVLGARPAEGAMTPRSIEQEQEGRIPPQSYGEAAAGGLKKLGEGFIENPEAMALATVAPEVGLPIFTAQGLHGVVQSLPQVVNYHLTGPQRLQAGEELAMNAAMAAGPVIHGVFPEASATNPRVRRAEFTGPAAAGSLLETPRGASVPRGELPEGLKLNTPEEAAAQALQMTQEATATPGMRRTGIRGVQNPPGERTLAPRAEVPQGPAEAPEVEPATPPTPQSLESFDDFAGYLKAYGRPDMTRAQIQEMFPQHTIGKEAAGDLAKQAFGENWKPGGSERTPASGPGFADINETTRLQPPPNSVDAALHFLGNRSAAETAFREGLDALKTDDQKAVISRVDASLENDEIFNSVVKFVPVSVMNDLVGKDVSAESLLNNKAMLKDKLSAGISEPSVRLPVLRFLNAMLSSPEIVAAIKGAELPVSSDLRGFSPEGNAAVITPESHVEKATEIAAELQQQPTPGEQNAIKQRTEQASVQPERARNDESGTPTEAGTGGGIPNATPIESETPGEAKVSPAEMIDQAHKAGRVTTNISQEAGRAVTTVADLDELLKKHNEVVAAHKDLMARIRSEKDPVEKAKLIRQGFSDNLNPQYYREAIETATDIMSNSNEADARLGKEPYERPLNWRTHEDAANWVREHAKEIYPDNFGNLPEELQAKPATKADETGATLEPKPGYVRLYNGKGGVAGAGESGAFWTTDLNYARNFGAVSYVDVPQDVFDASRKKMRETGTGGPHVILEDKYVRQAKPMENQPSQTVHDLTPGTKPAEPGTKAPEPGTKAHETGTTEPETETVTKAASKVEAQVDKVVATEGTRPAKEIKSELVDHIQKSIDDAPSEFDALSKAIKAKGATVALNAEKFAAQARDVQKDIPKITIDIPGDGKFTIRNTKEALQTLLERAKTISTAPGAPVKVKRRGVSVEQGRQFAKEAEVKPTGVADAIQDALDRHASEALKRIDERDKGTKFGSGADPAHYLKNAADYAIYGAAKLAKLGIKGLTKSAEWINEMRKAFGRKIDPHLDAIYEAAKAHLEQYRQQMGGKGRPTDAQSIINEATGVRRQIDSTSAAIDAMQTGLRTVRALQEHFKNAPSVSKAEVKLADNWLEADANRIRDGLTDLVKRELPLEERGKFITAINNASKRSPILTGDPEGMYRRAAKLAAKIEDRAQEVRKGAAIADLRTTVNRALASPGVDIGYKNRILDLLKRVSLTKPTEETLSKLKSTRDYLDRMAAEGKDVEMPREILDHLELLTKIPLRDLPLNAVQALADKIGRLEQLGRLKVKARAEAWEIEKRSRMADLPAEATNPLEKRSEFVPQPGDPTPPSIKMRNYLNRLLNAASTIDKAYLPMDAVFDMLGDAKANYRGWLFRNIRGPLDLAFNEYSVLRDQITDPISALVKKYKMGQREAERINTYARAMQEGGIERLVAQGVEPKTIDKIISSFTPAERHVYSEMRKRMDELLPQMQKLMHELYNIDVKPVENYWPLPRDWEAMRDMLKPAEAPGPTFGEPMTFDDLAGWKDMFADFTSPKTTKAEAGATIERKPKALTPVQNNAFDVFYQHINDVAYLLKTQRDLKMAGEMARSDLFQNKYGKVGQGLILDFLDTFARQGRLGGLRRIPWLDQLRTRTAVGIIGFRVASNLVHASNVAFSIERAGIQNYSAALAEIASGKADDFMHANFAEAFSRGGGEPGLVEAAAKGQSVFGKTVVPKELARASMAGARAIDRINAEATMLGVYFKELRRKGIDPATYKDMPIDKEAQAYAMVLARRAVASPLPKDVPSFISRGTLTGGNISVGKSVGQFQNIFADQWSNIRLDLWRAGIRQADPIKAARMTLAIMGVMALETGIREGVKAGLGALSGKKEKEQDLTGVVLREGIRRFPLGGQATAAILYDSSGVPMIDAFWDPAKEAYRSVNAKSPQKQNQHAIKALTGAGQLMGLPVGQLGEIVSDAAAQ